jgi:hypothetical protein
MYVDQKTQLVADLRRVGAYAHVDICPILPNPTNMDVPIIGPSCAQVQKSSPDKPALVTIVHDGNAIDAITAQFLCNVMSIAASFARKLDRGE